MCKKLHKVEITRIAVVFAEDENEAKRIAVAREGEDLNLYPDFVFASEVDDIGDVPQSWVRCTPLFEGEHPQSTIEDLIAFPLMTFHQE